MINAESIQIVGHLSQTVVAIFIAIYVALTYGLWKEARRSRTPYLNVQWDVVELLDEDTENHVNEQERSYWEELVKKNYDHVEDKSSIPKQYWVGTFQNVGEGFITGLELQIKFLIQDVTDTLQPTEHEIIIDESVSIAPGQAKKIVFLDATLVPKFSFAMDQISYRDIEDTPRYNASGYRTFSGIVNNYLKVPNS